ncbi:MAG: heme ABC exporter ATP-binding protein CcmA [Alphaproteobacteria bacterium]|uniref:Heme ABC exporter ATP-binding protein CcmA n=1 Tax=PS1 clade bacterium TaxID=2175152 RepID=A0A368DS58_9PROT|nr:heme ABC exporter ATP-binding protein CcmA [Rhodobiaceae bacterium]OUT74769.1 MAG: heme ABC exporter ATP-binding protein CcmA [Rhizobiales bacterium TMED25]RCL74649.1 MAG: heme ABC exporter ATP-binding protein CcmA [PS1 clade bacterium]|tara:strand:- start:12572 stop:13174 length:603 start_codon:yes stop_codon:yes gene_type:complete
MKLYIQDLNFSYDNGLIFNNQTHTLSSNRITLLLGQNGSGKSTFLKIIAGLEKPNSGSIKLRDNNDKSLKFNGNISYLGHKLALKEELTVQENIKFWHNFYGKDLLAREFEELGLDKLSSMIVSNLSAGQKKKLALYRILMSNKDIWLLDEPFSNLDKKAYGYLRELLLMRLNNDRIIIITSHSKLDLVDKMIINLDVDL